MLTCILVMCVFGYDSDNPIRTASRNNNNEKFRRDEGILSSDYLIVARMRALKF